IGGKLERRDISTRTAIWRKIKDAGRWPSFKRNERDPYLSARFVVIGVGDQLSVRGDNLPVRICLGQLHRSTAINRHFPQSGTASVGIILVNHPFPIGRDLRTTGIDALG